MSKDRGIGVIGYQDVVQCSYVGSKRAWGSLLPASLSAVSEAPPSEEILSRLSRLFFSL